MINILIPSMNRAAQLDLTLTTLKKYFKEWKDQTYSIIYKAGNTEYKRGYELLKKYHPELCFQWIPESNFCQDTRNAFNNTIREYTAFLVDDDVFVDYMTLDSPEVKAFMRNPTILCVSPRIAPYVNFCYTQNAPQPPPAHFYEERSWEWNGLFGDWGYPMSIAAFHIFRTLDLAKAINNVYFPAPNYLEGVCLDPNRPNRPLMICFETSKCITATNNRVQSVNTNRNENTNPLDKTNEVFLSGKRLDPDANHQTKLNMCHGPLKLVFK